MLRDTSAQTAINISAQPMEEARPSPSFMKPYWWDDLDANGPTSSAHQKKLRPLIKSFIEGTMKKSVRMDSGNGNHRYYTKCNGTELWLHKNNPSIKVHICLVKKIGDIFVGNSSSLWAQRVRPAGAKRARITFIRSGPQCIQEVLSECMPMIPFRTFKEIKLDVNHVQIVDKGQDEIVDVGRKEPLHFTGAMVFKIAVNKRSQGIEGRTHEYFLFDIDRNELKMRNFNAFLSKLKRPVKSIEEAYDSLKPQEVKDAERFLREVPRQGEWFFIPVQGEYKSQNAPMGLRGLRTMSGKTVMRGILRAGENRAHRTQYMSPEGFVKGKVSHDGREHKSITLKGWHKPVPNTAIESFKISGDVD